MKKEEGTGAGRRTMKLEKKWRRRRWVQRKWPRIRRDICQEVKDELLGEEGGLRYTDCGLKASPSFPVTRGESQAWSHDLFCSHSIRKVARFNCSNYFLLLPWYSSVFFPYLRHLKTESRDIIILGQCNYTHYGRLHFHLLSVHEPAYVICWVQISNSEDLLAFPKNNIILT